MPHVKGLVVAAPFSGGGKTVLSCGIISAWRAQGLQVAPFKVGPDYIDPGHLSQAAGRPCYNLDPWMTGPEGVRHSFARGAQGAERVLIEGVMGLFDGAGGAQGSTAEVAKLLGLPVLLVFPAERVGPTVAALLRGLMDFDPGLKFAGVVLTKVASTRHQRLLTEALAKAKIPLLGCIPRKERLKLPSRHLGLVLAEESSLDLETLGKEIRAHLDLTALEKALGEALFSPPPRPQYPLPEVPVAFARDEAFCFYYQENLDLLQEAGARLLFFSPLRDDFPAEAKALYLGGGYPELHAATLAKRLDLREELRTRLLQGLPVWAECGGFMFLQKALYYQGEEYPMVGALDGIAVVHPKLRALGYRQLTTLSPSPLGPAQTVLKGHEFRYSSLKRPWAQGFTLRDAWGAPVEGQGLVEGSLFTSYVHVHLGSRPEAARYFVAQAALF